MGALTATATKNSRADHTKTLFTHSAILNATPAATGNTTGQELSGGSPAYARKALSWGTTTAGVTTATATHDIPAGATAAAVSVHNSATASGSPDTTYRDAFDITDQVFASQGTLTVTLTYTDS